MSDRSVSTSQTAMREIRTTFDKVCTGGNDFPLGFCDVRERKLFLIYNCGFTMNALYEMDDEQIDAAFMLGWVRYHQKTDSMFQEILASTTWKDKDGWLSRIRGLINIEVNVKVGVNAKGNTTSVKAGVSQTS